MVPAIPRSVRRMQRVGFTALVAAGIGRAQGQAPGATPTVPASLSGSETQQVWARLDPVAIGVVLVGIVILVLFGVLIVQMIRREKPQHRATTARKPRRPTDDDSLERPTITANTDWGFDQNKRSSATRAPVTVDRSSGAAASLDRAATHWSASEVQSAAEASFQPGESMGKPVNAPPSPYRTSHNPFYTGETAVADTSIEVEEVADVLLQAELLVQLGDPKQAMLLLSQHIHETEQPGPAVWLMLLNLYQTTGRKAQYDALARGFVTLFNAAVPPWATSSDVGTRDLESYSQVMMRLQTGWPKPEIRTFLEQLLNDDRGGSRQGFSLTAYREILFLIEVFAVLERMSADEEERDRIQQKLSLPT